MQNEQEKKILKTRHNVIMENRRSLTISGVMDIDSFDEDTVIVFTEEGELTVKGGNLHINKIDLDTGDVFVEGEVDSLTYSQAQPQKGSLFSRLFR
jgi:sporulation protein YabP